MAATTYRHNSPTLNTGINMTTEIDEKTYNESIKLAQHLSIRIAQMLSCEVMQNVPPDLMTLDADKDYFFTLHMLGSFIKEMAYSLEIYCIMRQKSFPAEKTVEMIKQIALELMKDKKSDFQKILDNVMQQVVKEGTGAAKH
jgi:hypothetical protein